MYHEHLIPWFACVLEIFDGLRIISNCVGNIALLSDVNIIFLMLQLAQLEVTVANLSQENESLKEENARLEKIHSSSALQDSSCNHLQNGDLNHEEEDTEPEEEQGQEESTGMNGVAHEVTSNDPAQDIISLKEVETELKNCVLRVYPDISNTTSMQSVSLMHTFHHSAANCKILLQRNVKGIGLLKLKNSQNFFFDEFAPKIAKADDIVFRLYSCLLKQSDFSWTISSLVLLELSYSKGSTPAICPVSDTWVNSNIKRCRFLNSWYVLLQKKLKTQKGEGDLVRIRVRGLSP